MAPGPLCFYTILKNQELLFKVAPSRMKTSKSIGDDDEIKQTFLFHSHECLPRFIDMFRLFIYMGGVLFYGIDVVLGTIAQPCWFNSHFHHMECLYVEKGTEAVLGTGDLFLSWIHCDFCLFLDMKPRNPSWLFYR